MIACLGCLNVLLTAPLAVSALAACGFNVWRRWRRQDLVASHEGAER